MKKSKISFRILMIFLNIIFVLTNARIRPRKVMLYWRMKETQRKKTIQKELDAEHSTGKGIQVIDGKQKNYIPFNKYGYIVEPSKIQES